MSKIWYVIKFFFIPIYLIAGFTQKSIKKQRARPFYFFISCSTLIFHLISCKTKYGRKLFARKRNAVNNVF